MTVRKVSRPMAQSAQSEEATIEAARGVLYMSASSPKVLPAAYERTCLPRGSSRPSSAFLTKHSRVPLQGGVSGVSACERSGYD